jgi:hypothetical protein
MAGFGHFGEGDCGFPVGFCWIAAKRRMVTGAGTGF